MTITAPAPNGFLYAFLDSGLPGQRSVTRPGGGVITAPENYLQFTDWLAAIDAAIYADHGSRVALDTATGKVRFTAGTSGAFQFDRTGVLTGLTTETDTNYTMSSGGAYDSTFIPAGAIWLMGAEMTQIEYARELKFDSFRWRRGYGYSWGGVRLHRWKLTMHKDALEAFERGWCCSLDYGFRDYELHRHRISKWIDWLCRGSRIARLARASRRRRRGFNDYCEF